MLYYVVLDECDSTESNQHAGQPDAVHVQAADARRERLHAARYEREIERAHDQHHTNHHEWILQRCEQQHDAEGATHGEVRCKRRGKAGCETRHHASRKPELRLVALLFVRNQRATHACTPA